ncbi:hypothetical protein N665_0218s0021 [Sinapis alba]|nr:hypothetical protein N665_0218s0021 [Sinapis alba]
MIKIVCGTSWSRLIGVLRRICYVYRWRLFPREVQRRSQETTPRLASLVVGSLVFLSRNNGERGIPMDTMTKHVSVHFKFKNRIYSVNMKSTVEDITLAILEERLYKKLILDEMKVKLKLRYMPMVVGCEKEFTICDDEYLFVYVTSIDKDNRRFFFREAVKSGRKFVWYELRSVAGNDDEIGPNAITLYVENGQANQQKKMIEAENDDNTTRDDFPDTDTAAETDTTTETDTAAETDTA